MPDTDTLSPVLYIPHGGGPLPLLGDPSHASLIAFLESACGLMPRPKSILLISAHWEEEVCTVQSAATPELYYDYYGFPPESYQLQYPAPGNPLLASRIIDLLQASGIACRSDADRGFDHGLFIPLKLIYPEADIPCLQLSLLDSMDPADHIALGRALAPLRREGVLILGSGQSFHNMNAFRDASPEESRRRCREFDQWLAETCCQTEMAEAQTRLSHWPEAPFARYAHPREEHLIPLHVCFGAAMAAGGSAEHVFNGDMMGYTMSSFLWR